MADVSASAVCSASFDPAGQLTIAEGLTSMKRALVFMLLAPVSVFFIVFTVLLMLAGPSAKSPGLAPFVAMALSLLTLPASAITGAVDGYLARVLPITLRASLTAIVGAMAGAAVPCGFAFVMLSRLPPPSILMLFAIGGAVVMGACSLLSYDYSGRLQPSNESGSSMKNRLA
jgi:hypothetical protein